MSSLKRQAASGVKWTATSTAISTTMQYLKIAVLARLLSTTDFGLMGMTLVIINLAYYMVDLGISGAIIYRQDATKEELSTLYWINVLFGALLCLLAIVTSPLVVAFFHETALYGPVIISSFNFILFSVGLQFGVLMQKELQFRRLAWVEITSSTCGAVVAIILAVAGSGVYSLVFGFLTETTVRSAMLMIVGWSHWHPGRHFRFSDAKRYLSFGMFQMGDRITTYLSSNIDYIWIGRFLGAEQLGIYTLVYNLIVNPIARINPIITKVAFPVFAKKQDDEETLRRGYGEISRMLALIVIPILAGIALTAPVFIPLIFGDKWLPAVPLLQVMVVAGFFRTFFTPVGSILYARGRAGQGFGLAVFMAATNTVVFFFVARHGLEPMVWAWVVVSFVFYMISLAMLHEEIGLKYGKYFGMLWMPLCFSAVMAAGTYLLYRLLWPSLGVSLLHLVLLVLCGVLIYALLLLLFMRGYLREYIRLLLGKEDRPIQPEEPAASAQDPLSNIDSS